jgi:hypothetical protein
VKPELTTTYLFEDGHAVQIFQKHDRDCGTISFAVITEKFTKAVCSFTGRITLGRSGNGVAGLLRDALQIRAKTPSIENGSDNTRERKLAVGYLMITTKDGEIIFTTIPDLISAPFSYQAGPTYEEKFDPKLTQWAHCRVARIVRLAKPASAPAAPVLRSAA